MDKYFTQMRVGFWTDWIGQPMETINNDGTIEELEKNISFFLQKHENYDMVV
jgi:hypothetical protein